MHATIATTRAVLKSTSLDGFAMYLLSRCITNLCTEITDTVQENRRGSLALGLGCIFRLKGSMSTQSMIPSAVDSLFSLMKSSTADVYFWALHGLLLLANAAGLAYLSYVEKTLRLCRELMVSPSLLP